MPQQQTPGGFGGFPGAGNQAAFTNSNGQLNGNYADPYANPASSGFSNNLPLQNDFAGSPASRMASSNTGGSGSPSMISPVTTSLPTGTSTNSNDFAANANDETPSAAKSKAADNILPVLFLLSLIVNFYLGMILRKLLVRYRAAVRQQPRPHFPQCLLLISPPPEQRTAEFTKSFRCSGIRQEFRFLNCSGIRG